MGSMKETYDLLVAVERRKNLENFARESNQIEGIPEVTEFEIRALSNFLDSTTVRFDYLLKYLKVCQADAVLRVRRGLDVTVGDYVAPPGGPDIGDKLDAILRSIPELVHPYLVHQHFEKLHPFTDGNGRMGRAIWAWQMVNQKWDNKVGLRRSFLHSWYYQSLSHFRN